MYPSEWAGKHIEALVQHHRVVWVEDPYKLVDSNEVSNLRHRIMLFGQNLLVVENGFDLRHELLSRDPANAPLVVIDQSYRLRQPHLLPKDAKPADLMALPAPDWKPFLEQDAIFKPSVQGFLKNVTDDARWPVEVNIYPYEELARRDPDGFVRAFDSFRQSGRPLTSNDLLMIGASAALEVDLIDLNDPFVAMGLAFHSDPKWRDLAQFFNPMEIGEIRSRLQGLPSPLGNLFGPDSDAARLALTALLVLRQHLEDPGVHLPVLFSPLTPFANSTVAAAPESPSWFLEEEVPRFEQLLTPKFSKYLYGVLRLNEKEAANRFASRERFSPKLRSLVLSTVEVEISPRPEAGSAEDFELGRLVPDFRKAKQRLTNVIDTAKRKVESVRLTSVKSQTIQSIFEVFDGAGIHEIDTLSGHLTRLIRDIEGPARRQWDSTPGFEQRWRAEVRVCRDLVSAAARLEEDLDYLFGRLLEARFCEIAANQVLTTRSFYERYIFPHRRGTENKINKAIVLVVDSMRFDLWRQLIRPVLERDYRVQELQDSVALSELPSETRVSRFSFFAGKAPGEVPSSCREPDLFAELLSRCHGSKVTFDDQGEKRPGMRFSVRSKDGLTLAAVFDFADVLSHRIDWDPHTVQESLRPLVREIRAMLAAEGPEPLVFITADHGHHLHESGAPIFLENTSNVGYRSAYVTRPLEGRDRQHVFQIPAADLGHKLPGWFVFPKPRFYLRGRSAEQGIGRPGAGYRHGGLSLFEVAVPLACLVHRRVPAKINITVGMPGRLMVGESGEIEVRLTADAQIQSPVRLEADTSDVEPVMVSGVSSSPTVHQLRFTPLSPGRRRIRITARLGDQDICSAEIEADIASPPAPEDEVKAKLRKLFGED
jgi:hypothetical protein